MIVTAVCEFHLPAVHSLKEKRAVLQSMKRKVRQRFNVAIAEMEHQELWQRSVVEIVTVSSQFDVAEQILDQAIALLEQHEAWELIRVEKMEV